jgi:Transglycosylase SLT domain
MALAGAAQPASAGASQPAFAGASQPALAGASQPALAGDASGAAACQSAGMEAERRFELPPGLLLAIGVVESGRLDPVSGRMAAWPWTINANGAGELFEDLPHALAGTRMLQRRGVTSIDVGCFQINLRQHPTAFASLEEAFDPAANAAYAARFLLELRTRTGGWESAIAAYHSATPALGLPYRENVLAALTQASETTGGATNGIGSGVANVVRTAGRLVVWTPSSASDGMRIWRPDAPGTAPGVIVIRQWSSL